MTKGGRYVYRPGHPKASDFGMVHVDDLGDEVPQEGGLNGATIMSGRFYENLQSPIDGSDIGSRQRYHDHMKRHGVAPTSDFKQHWAKAEKDRTQNPTRNMEPVSETIGRVWHQLENGKRR
jgi:hypothetical protein